MECDVNKVEFTCVIWKYGLLCGISVIRSFHFFRAYYKDNWFIWGYLFISGTIFGTLKLFSLYDEIFITFKKSIFFNGFIA
ncbi:hypothetical protein BpHYR1_047065 [Brachionus plicatilis]|uniref:Uncharacterized protein n=1 Tax=Brachionus plicatilis TaxID=10195 RepID=A0A3M7RYF1_BRAPC|nr:hypothetical protein BpHYR1_047065 [Brachionus plicatilis]